MYLQVQVNERCLKLLTINTPKRLYKFNRFPVGVKVAPSIFKQIMDTMLASLDFAIAYLSDVLIKSENRRQHCENIKNLFERIKEYSFKLSPGKYEFFMSQIKYSGEIIDVNGRCPDPTSQNVTTL